MDNPYWYSDGQRHHVDLISIERLCFDLTNIFEASRPLAEEFDLAESEEEKKLTESDIPLLRLHQKYAFEHVSKTLLQLALMVRTYDDQMKDSDKSEQYIQHITKVDDGHYVGILHNKDNFKYREACNKVIHAVEIRPLYERVDRVVSDALNDGNIGQDIWYLTGEIELQGQHRGNNWNAVLHTQQFIETVLDVIEFGSP